MAAYATYTDVQNRLSRTLSESEQTICTTLLEDAGLIIDAYNSEASSDAKLTVSCRMVVRAIGDGTEDAPIGATQGTVSALGYSQSWTIGSGSVGELYLNKLDKKLLGVSKKINFKSPLEDMVEESDD